MPDNGVVTRTATADLRWLRAVVAAAVAVTIGTTAHVGAGGLLPGPGVLVAVVLALTVVFAAALGRPASYALVAVLVGGGQAVVHLALTALSGHGGSPTPVVDAHRGHAHVADELAATGEAGSLAHVVEHLRDDLVGANLVMALAHLAASAVVAAWLFAGEQALWTLVALLGAHLVGRLLAAVRAAVWLVLPDPSRPAPAAVSPVVPRLLDRLLTLGTLARRGPPLLVAAPPHPPTS